jgi:hypothetical protein
MRPVRVTVGALGVSNPIILDHYQRPFSVGIGAALSAGASLTFSIEHTFDDVFAANFNPSTAVWYSDTSLSSKTASTTGNYAYPVMAIRINVTAYTSGSVTMTVIQAGIPGG